MRQFDVCAVSGRAIPGSSRLVVVLQHHDFQALSGVIVAPMYPANELVIFETLRLRTTFKRRAYVIALDRMASMPKRGLGPPLGNLEPLHFELMKAVDLIFSGF